MLEKVEFDRIQSMEIIMTLRCSKSMKALAALSLLGILALPAYAADPNNAPGAAGGAVVSPPPRGTLAWCRANPEECKQLRAQRHVDCTANPEHCDTTKMRRHGLHSQRSGNKPVPKAAPAAPTTPAGDS
jgi:hypothetical protein